MTSGIVFVGFLVDCKRDAGVLSGKSGLEGIFEGEDIGERKMMTGLEVKSIPEGVKVWKSSSGSEKDERQSSRGEKVECSAALKKSKKMNRGNWSYGLVKLGRTHYGVEVLFLFLRIFSHTI